MQDPLKQGLKQKDSKYKKRIVKSIRMQDPLKQGLKLRNCIFANAFSDAIRMQDPLKQGLKLPMLANPKVQEFLFECKIH